MERLTTKSFTVYYTEEGGREYSRSVINNTGKVYNISQFAKDNCQDLDITFYQVEIMKEED
tara:strand:- start:170 stop:352 length:183 start_codon:yes stop_codon:yes gene_type:complete